MANEMKDSGVEWIGEIPKEWSTGRLKDYLQIFNGREIESEEGVIPVYGSGGAFKRTDKALCVEPSILFGRKGTIDKPLYVEGPFWTVDTMFYSKPRNGAVLKYLFYAATCFNYDFYLTGSTLPSMTQSDLGSIRIPCPSAEEQRRIVREIKAKTTEEDGKIETLSHQIDVLERYRKSVIHEAVTKGLDPDVAMKPSGVEWIGRIPEHWSTIRLKYAASLKTGQTPPTDQQEYFDGDVKWYTPGDITGRYLVAPERTLSSKALTEGKAPAVGANSVLLVGIGATAGKTGYLETAGSCNQQITALLPHDDIDSRYLYWQISSNSNELLLNALFTTLPIINNGYLENWILAIPPQAEQIAIADYLDGKTTKIDAILDIKRNQVEVLKKRRQSLIYEYVTGKKRVGKED